MITHDRYFLDSVTNRIVELDNGKLYSYQANYEGFLELKAERMDMEKASERKRQSILRTELAWMQRGASTFHKAERQDPALRGTAGQKRDRWRTEKSRWSRSPAALGGRRSRSRISVNHTGTRS